MRRGAHVTAIDLSIGMLRRMSVLLRLVTSSWLPTPPM